MSDLTKAQVRVLTFLADSDHPLSVKELATSAKTVAALLDEALVQAHEIRTTKPDEEGGEEVITYTYSITDAGRAALAPQPEAEQEAKLEPTLSATLVRCLSVLEDGKWHSFRDLNTSTQNVGRLAERGLANLHVGEDKIKRLQITDKGREELAYNRDLV